MAEKKSQAEQGRSRTGRLEARKRRLRQAAEKTDLQMRSAALGFEERVERKFFEETGAGFEKAVAEAEEHYLRELQQIQRERRRLRKDAKALAVRQKEEFDRNLALAVGKGGLDRLIEKAYHNPALRMKYATQWQGETSPPLGMYGGMDGRYEAPTAAAEYRFDTIEDPEFGPFCDTIHPLCYAHAGSSRRGYASAWVTQQLTFTHRPPRSQILIDTVSVSVTAFGYGESSPAYATFLTISGAMSFGGYSELLISIWVEQEFIWPSGLRGNNRVDIVTDHVLAAFYSRGSVWVFRGLMAAPEWGLVDVRALRLSYPTLFPLYGTSNSREPLGEEVKVHVEFKCRAEADHRDASGVMEFNDTGQRIKVHQVLLEYPG